MSSIKQRRKYPKPTEVQVINRQSSRIMRFIRLHRLYQRRKGVFSDKLVASIAEDLGVTPRSVYRELRLLKHLYLSLKSQSFDK